MYNKALTALIAELNNQLDAQAKELEYYEACNIVLAEKLEAIMKILTSGD